jgi:hypothetical protein
MRSKARVTAAALDYKGFVIEAYRSENELWKIRFRKIDESPIADVTGEQVPSRDPPNEYPTADAAIERAKELIDAGGMS